MDFLPSADHWYMDGTVDSVPPQFETVGRFTDVMPLYERL